MFMTPSSDHQSGVIECVEAMTAAFHAGDLAALLSTYEPGACVAFEPGQAVCGEAALGAGFSSFFEVMPRFSYIGHDVLAAGDLALHIAPWTMRGTAPDGTPLHQQGLSVAVLRRSSQGHWKLVLDNPFGDRLLPGGDGQKAAAIDGMHSAT